MLQSCVHEALPDLASYGPCNILVDRFHLYTCRYAVDQNQICWDARFEGGLSYDICTPKTPSCNSLDSLGQALTRWPWRTYLQRISRIS